MGTRLTGKVAIVTGAGRGLGQASARRFAAEGATVVCADLDERAAVGAASQLVADGARASAFGLDVVDEQATDAMAQSTLERYGAIDVLFANAGVSAHHDALSCELETWNRVIGVNLTGSWLCSRAVLPAMIAAGQGSIILMSSAAGAIGIHGGCAYAAAKAGVTGLTRQFAVDYGPHGVRVNAIVPGGFLTPLVRASYQARVAQGKFASVEEGLGQAGMHYPLRRLGTDSECANLALFLASDESSFVTGSLYAVDGGFTGTREYPPREPQSRGSDHTTERGRKDQHTADPDA
jgi:NAD(P)-dependent dehydrogenase (short-subunit alcohol dehydrogenase family)